MANGNLLRQLVRSGADGDVGSRWSGGRRGRVVAVRWGMVRGRRSSHWAGRCAVNLADPRTPRLKSAIPPSAILLSSDSLTSNPRSVTFVVTGKPRPG